MIRSRGLLKCNVQLVFCDTAAIMPFTYQEFTLLAAVFLVNLLQFLVIPTSSSSGYILQKEVTIAIADQAHWKHFRMLKLGIWRFIASINIQHYHSPEECLLM